MSYTLNNVSFEDLGIESATLTRSGAAVDSLVVTIKGGIEAEQKFAANAQVLLREVLDNGSTAIRFRGWMDDAPRRLAGGGMWTYTFNGPQRWIELANYEQDFKTIQKSEAGEVIVVNNGALGLTMLGRDVSVEGEQGHVSLKDALAAVLDFAIADQGHFTHQITATLEPRVPWEPRQDDNCMNAARALLKWSPLTIWRWNDAKLEVLTPTTVGMKSLIAAGVEMRDVQLRARDDLLCLRTRIKYLRKGQTTAQGTSYATQIDLATGGEGAARFSTRTAACTIYLEEGEDFPEPGIAAEFHKFAGKLHITAQATLRGINWANKPGDMWSANGGLGHEEHPSVCQTIIRDLFRNNEVLVLGVPGHLNLSDYVNLKRKPRRPDTGLPPGEDNETGTLDMNITGLPDALKDDANWTADEYFGTGANSIDIPPGSYSVRFLPVFDVPTGRLWYAPPVSGVEILEGGVTPVTGAYARADLSPNHPWKPVDESGEGGYLIHIKPGNVNGDPPSGMDPTDTSAYTFTPSGTGVAWVAVAMNTSTGAVSSASISHGSAAPDTSDSTLIVPLFGWGFVEGDLSFSIFRTTDIWVTACRQWHTDPPKWSFIPT